MPGKRAGFLSVVNDLTDCPFSADTAIRKGRVVLDH